MRELGGLDELWWCLKHVPAGQAYRCTPALWGEMPPGVPPMPRPKPSPKGEGSPWPLILLGLGVLWLLRR